MPGPQGLNLQFQQDVPLSREKANEAIWREAARLLNEPHKPFQSLSPEALEKQRQKIEELDKLRAGPEGSIQINIASNLAPIGVSPLQLMEIIKNKDFAQQLISEATNSVRVPSELVNDLQQRADAIYRSNEQVITEAAKKEESQKPIISKQELEKNEELSKINHEKIQQYKEYLKNLEKVPNLSEPGYQLGTLAGYFPEKSNIPGTLAEKIWKDYRGNPSSHYHVSNKEVDKEKEKIINLINNLDISNKKIPLNTNEINIHPLLKRAGAEREIQKLLAPQQNVAPLEPQHYQALELLEKSLDNDTFKLAKKQLTDAEKHNVLSKVEPWVKESVEAPDKYTQDYINNYKNNVIKALRDESERSLLEDIIPKIEGRYISKGAYHSGAREGTIGRAIEANSRSLNNEIRKLLSHAHDKAMEHHQEEKSRRLAASQVIGGAVNQQREGEARTAEQLRNLGLTEQTSTGANLSALSHFGSAAQNIQQQRLNQAREEHLRQQQAPMENLKVASNILQGFPVGSQQQVSLNPTYPTVISPYTLASTGIGALAMLANPQQAQLFAQQKAKGGLVRKRYADGGHVNSPSYQDEMRNLMLQKEMDYGRQLQEIRQPNILNSLTSNITQSMLSNIRGRPFENVGKGIAATLEGMATSKQREANLIDKINESRMQQYQLLADFENRKAEREHKENILSETNRRHAESLAQSARHHQENLSAKYAKLEREGGKENTETKEMIKTRIKKNKEIRDEMEELLKASEEGLKTSNALEAVTNRTNTGPIASSLYEYIPGIGPYLHEQLGFGSRNDIQELEGLATEAALAEERTYPAKAQTVALLNAIQRTKPSKSLLKKENIRRAQQKKEKFLKGENKAKFIISYVDNGYGDEVEALKKYNELRRNEKSKGKNIISSKEENTKEEPTSSSDNFGEWDEYDAIPIPNKE